MNLTIKKLPFFDVSDFVKIANNGLNEKTCVELSQLFVDGIEKQLNVVINVFKFIKNSDNDLEFLKVVNSLYDVSLNQYKDYCNIFSIAYSNSSKIYNRSIINTYMVSEKLKFANGKVVREQKGTSFRIAHSDDFVKRDGRYTIGEIKKLIEDKKIIILEEFDDDIIFSTELFENYEKFEVYKKYQGFTEEYFFYPCVIMYLRDILTNKKIIKDVREYLIYLRIRILNILSDLSIFESFKEECLKQLDDKEIFNILDLLINFSYDCDLDLPLNDKIDYKLIKNKI